MITEAGFDIANPSKPTRFRQGNADATEAIRMEIDGFLQTRGRRPRILLGRPIGHNGRRAANRAAARFARYGFDVDISPAHTAPRQIARMAMENDVHLVYLLSEGDVVPELTKALEGLACDDIAIASAPHPPDADDTRPRVPRIDPDHPDEVLQFLKELMTTCQKN